jgi:hypothetical protein
MRFDVRQARRNAAGRQSAAAIADAPAHADSSRMQRESRKASVD